MVSIMHSVYTKRARRCFHPPIVIKDADAIMTKVIRHLMKVRIELFDNGMLRWKMFMAKIKYQKLTSNLE